MTVFSNVRMWDAPASKPGSSLTKTSLYLRHQPRWRASLVSLIRASVPEGSTPYSSQRSATESLLGSTHFAVSM